MEIVAVFFQCARAIVRAELWSGRPAPERLPTSGAMLEEVALGEIYGSVYDADWPSRAALTMW